MLTEVFYVIGKSIRTNTACCWGKGSHLTSLSVLGNFAPRTCLHSEPLSKILFRTTLPGIASGAFLLYTVNYYSREVITVQQDSWGGGKRAGVCSHYRAMELHWRVARTVLVSAIQMSVLPKVTSSLQSQIKWAFHLYISNPGCFIQPAISTIVSALFSPLAFWVCREGRWGFDSVP